MTSIPVGFHVINSLAAELSAGQLRLRGARRRPSPPASTTPPYYYHGFDRAAGVPASPPKRPASRCRSRRSCRTSRPTTRLCARLPHHRPGRRRCRLCVEPLHLPRRGRLRQRPAVQPRSPHPGQQPVAARRPQIAEALRQIAAGHLAGAGAPAAVVRGARRRSIGASASTTPGTDYVFLLQVNQTDVLNNDVDLLIKNVDTVLSANLRGNFLHDDLTVQLIGVQGFESGYTMLMPRIDLSLLGALRCPRRLPVHRRQPELGRSVSTRTTTKRSSGSATSL